MKKLFFLTLFCFYSLTLLSQSWQWAKNPGGTSDDYGDAIRIDGAGNSYVTGGILGTASFDSYTLSSQAGKGVDAFICKYDASGKAAWVKSAFADFGNDRGTDVEVDGDGNIYVSGYSSGEFFIVKLSPSGTVLLTINKVTGITEFDRYYIDLDSLNNIYLSGTFTSTIDFGSGPIQSNGHKDVFIAKFDPTGKNVWTRSGGSSTIDWCSGIRTDRNGNSILLGAYSNSAVFSSSSLSDGGMFLAKYDTYGNMQWLKRAASGGAEPSDLDFDNSGNIYVTGRLRSSFPISFGSLSPINPVSGNNSYYNAFISKFSTTGNALWIKQAGSKGWWSQGVKLRANRYTNSILLLGHFSNTLAFEDGGILTGANYDDLFLTEFDSNGSVLFKTSTGGADYEVAAGLDIDQTGNIYVSGTLDYTSGGMGSLTTTFGNISVTKKSGADDIFIAKFGKDFQLYTGSPGATFFCTGKTFSLPFTKKGIFTIGNSFKVQLSDSAGNFTSPTIIGSITDTAAGSIPVTVPSGLKSGSRYRVRVISTLPEVIGTNNGIDLMINSVKAWNNGAACSNSSIQLFASSVTGATYQWSGPNSFVATSQNPTVVTPVQGNYSLVVKVSGCADMTMKVPVVIQQAPTAPFVSSSSPVCGYGKTLELYSSYVENASYSWTGPQSFVSTLRNPVRANSFEWFQGTYTVKVTINGCSSSASTDVVFSYNTAPTISRTDNVLISSDAFTGTYQWNLNSTSITGQNKRTYAPNEDGQYTVAVTDDKGCTATSAAFNFQVSFAPEWEWVKQGVGATGTGGVYLDEFTSVAVDSSGFIYAGGHHGTSIKFDNLGSANSVNRTGIIVKYDQTGKALSLIRITGNNYNYVYDLECTKDNDLFVLGHFGGTATLDTITLTATAATQVFIAKYNAAGRIQWAKNLGPSSIGNMELGKSGSLYITGMFSASGTVNGLSVATGAFVMRVKPDGSVVWIKQPTGSGTSSKGKLALTSEEKIWVAGSNTGSINFESFSLPTTGNFLACFDSSGNVVNAKNIGTGGGINDLEIDSQENVYMTGYTLNSVKFGSVTITGLGNYLTKFNASGNLSWARKISPANTNNTVSSLYIHKDTIYMVGELTGTIAGKPSQNYDIYVANIDTAGIIKWVKVNGNDGFDKANDAIVDSQGNLFVVGAFEKTINFSVDRNTVTSTGYQDPFIGKIFNARDAFITTGFVPSPICKGTRIDIPFKTQALASGKTYLVQLSNNKGNFVNPITIGTSSNPTDSKIGAVFPDTLILTGTRRVRVVSNDLTFVGSTNGQNITIANPSISLPAFNGVFCQGAKVMVVYTAGCTLDSTNNFVAELSDKNGSFTSPTIIGSLKAVNSSSITTFLPSGLNPGTAYRIRVKSSSPSLTTPDNGSNLTVNNTPSLAVSNADSICSESLIDLSQLYTDTHSSTGITTFWKDNKATVNTTKFVSTGGTYYIMKTTSANCSDIKPVNVGFYPTPDLSITDVNVCEGQLANITTSYTDPTNTPGNVSYWKDANLSISLDQPTAISEPAAYYIKKVTSKNCMDVKAVIVNFNPNPDIQTTDKSSCEGSNIDLTQLFTDANSTEGTLSYWKDALATVSVAQPQSISIAGVYYIKKTTLKNCSDLKPVTIDYLPVPDLITSDLTLCAGSSVDLSTSFVDNKSTTGVISYWKDPSATTPLGNPELVTEEGTYYIKKTTSANACTDIEAIQVASSICTGINKSNSTSSLLVYPTPSQGSVHVNLPKNLYGKRIDLELYNLQGKLSNSFTIEGDKSEILLTFNGIEAGIYSLHVKSDNYYSISEIVIVK